MFQQCMVREDGNTKTEFLLVAANLIRVIEYLEGSAVAQERAITVLSRLLDSGAYADAGAVVQFLVRCGQDTSCVVLRDELVVKGVDSSPRSCGASTWP